MVNRQTFFSIVGIICSQEINFYGIFNKVIAKIVNHNFLAYKINSKAFMSCK